jgi:caffeoyl-CoA O-methyltransferase
MFAKMIGAKRILEIGMFTSTTTVALASLPQVKKVVAMDIEPYLLEFCVPFWERAGLRSKIDPRIGDARETLCALKDEGCQFEMVNTSFYYFKLHP